MKKYIAECVGTFVLTFLGCGTAMFLGCGTPAGVVGTAIAFGLAVVAMAYTIGEISGCHINPAITLGVALSGRMSWKEAAGYWVGQVIGGIIAGALLLLVASVVKAPDLVGQTRWLSIPVLMIMPAVMRWCFSWRSISSRWGHPEVSSLPSLGQRNKD